ncbi:UDP-glucuronosyltransferase 2A1-like [Musca vetustissima]|uniref:UDP-glucuronosyltransferase 2A1-like n=1 Tax=Musca vetustissima TaxID=27455 RepID=UPI002AB73FEB|nr:UDP-glucuronosyltransferase 2A1-like [Musca vetustissima]
MNLILMMTLISLQLCNAEHILMITMGGTKSHKIPFWELAKGLIEKGHHVTFLSGFKADFHIDGLKEITPMHLVHYIQNYTDWDLVGARYAHKRPVPVWQALRYPAEACNSLLESDDHTGVTVTDELLTQRFHLAIVDGAFPECALGIVHRLGLPFMFINTVGFYTGSLAMAGNPIAYAVTPHVFTALTETMNLWQRIENYVTHLLADLLHKFYSNQVHAVLIQHFSTSIPHPYALMRNVSIILQNGHASITYARPYYPNVIEIACLHCRPAGKLPQDLEQFMETAPAGVIFFSMGSSVRAANMPEEFRHMLIEVFSRLPQYHVLWKWDGNGTTTGDQLRAPILPNGPHQNMSGISRNVRLSGWLPQQDILGHRKLKAFVTHGGLLSMYEAIYHAVPMVMLPVFCDHDVNAAKAESDGYAIRLPLETITADKLYQAIMAIINNDKYKRKIHEKSQLLLDQMTKPMATAIYWAEYVMKHKDVSHLQSPVRNMRLNMACYSKCCLNRATLGSLVKLNENIVKRKQQQAQQQQVSGSAKRLVSHFTNNHINPYVPRY